MRWKYLSTAEGQLNKPDNSQSEEKRLEGWRKFDRTEDKIMALYSSEAADPGSTGCGLELHEIIDLMPDRPEGADPR